MNKKLLLAFKIIGIVMIVLGIILTVIPLFRFDGDTFKLLPAMMSGIILPMVGIIIIVIASIVGTNASNQDMMKNITSKMKDEINSENKKNSTSATITCKYCGCKCNKDDGKCKNCGAELK